VENLSPQTRCEFHPSGENRAVSKQSYFVDGGITAP